MTRPDRAPGRNVDPYGPNGRAPRSGSARGPGDRFGWLRDGLPIAPIVAVIGLLAVAFVTLSLSAGRLPFGAGPGGGNGAGPNVARTPTPSNVVVVPDDPRAHIPGTVVYAKDGNIWLQSGATATQLTTGGTDSMPSFSADGATVYFVRTREQAGLWPVAGTVRTYKLTVPSLVSIPTAGGTVATILDGLVDPSGKYAWSGWIREPVVSPDGRTLALVSDLPQPDQSDVVLHLLDVATGKLSNPGLDENPPMGHQDPAWRPDGKLLLYVRGDRDGAKGTPRIYAWTPGAKTAKALTGPGYLHPAWSSDGRWIAATKTSAFGTDVVILNAATGAEVLRVTTDGNSWGPTWSPKGDALAYLHVNGQVVDLRLVSLAGSGPGWTLGDALDLTTGAGLDSLSRPDWFIPADQLPPPTAAPGPSASLAPGAASGSPPASPAPS